MTKSCEQMNWQQFANTVRSVECTTCGWVLVGTNPMLSIASDHLDKVGWRLDSKGRVSCPKCT